MTDMGRGHEKIVITDNRRRTGDRATVDLDIFAKDILVADPQIGLFSFISRILRRVAQDRARMNFVPIADFRPTG